MKKKLQIASIIAEILLIIGVKTLFSPCGPKEDGSFMHCHQVANIIFVLGIVQLVLQLGLYFMKSINHKIELGVQSLIAVLSIVILLLPNHILPMCMMTSMRCQSVMRPFVLSVSSIILLVSVFAEVIGYKEVQKKQVLNSNEQ